MPKVWQEFFCGNCVGYIKVKLNTSLTYGVKVVCPNCQHEHHRYIKDGVIFESGRESNQPKEEICPPKSAYSKKALTEAMRKQSWKRDGVIIKETDVVSTRDPRADSIIQESWFERFGGRL